MELTRELDKINGHDVDIAGGKGASLGEMLQAGFPVPEGFVILAQTFDRFLDETDLAQEVEAQLDQVAYDDVSSVERASRVIQSLLTPEKFPKDLEAAVLEAFDRLQAEFVAVRSSATAEDSSVASWAGELETYLNTSRADLVANIVKCWASLFTPRAIFYRHEQNLHQTHVSVAVVVQTMVPSEVAGITFTVHPVTKDPNQMIIEACWGLGELIVGGRITPDAYVLDKRDGSLIDVNVSKQTIMLVRGATGNREEEVPADRQEKQKLDGQQIGELGNICINIEKHYGFPCDIEWAFVSLRHHGEAMSEQSESNGKFYILQSRPITTL